MTILIITLICVAYLMIAGATMSILSDKMWDDCAIFCGIFWIIAWPFIFGFLIANKRR